MRRAALLYAALLTACSPNGGRERDGDTGTDSGALAPYETADAAYETCDEAIADGAAPLEEGNDGYSEDLDADGDGIACENFSQTRDFEEVGDTSLCTDDCSGHNAGFDWARDHDIIDASDCGGYSRSFIEGCETYVSTLQGDEDT
ncbi:excalibur calcium-binding domain-containing protein [Sphingomonas hankyongi]|uniref:Excalibur calcium-binding domain-containing protein n=1 Tax=Sphingomonas hankyongi TaxID=2908209 RepID=A0ABT0S0B5_9SPHN|nr:excalibur calcium-binding domain-containing protein [Sphingomonas hankyongi]MCL6729176.1 excalibur calcium-binding domain-containing protein [Sphingomonas hankyongi]